MAVDEQFFSVVDRDEAWRRFSAALRLAPLEAEQVSLGEALGRVLAVDVVAAVDVPSFDRSNVDGFAVHAADTWGAQEGSPRSLRLIDAPIATGSVPNRELVPGEAMPIATGGMLPRGADAVVMVERTHVEAGRLIVSKAATAGAAVTWAGADIAAGETVARRGELLSSRETGVLAAVGVDQVAVWRRPKVAILSTGDELILPGRPMTPAMVYDSNSRILADAVREAGGVPLELGVSPDDLGVLRARLGDALDAADVVLLSGGTSKGAGDRSYRAVAELGEPGIVAHGVALKPGKPICLAVTRGKPVVVLPGFPTSAVFTFHEFVVPVIRALAGRPVEERAAVKARLAVQVNSEAGRTEYLLVGLVSGSAGEAPLVAYPMGKGSGSVTTFSRADGFVTIGRYEELLPAGSLVDVQLLSHSLRVADLVVIGSHCVGLDYLLGRLQEQGFRAKFLAVGSTAGLAAAERGECHLAGIHLLDPHTGQYNAPFVSSSLRLIRGYGRLQGVIYRTGDSRFAGRTAREAIAAIKDDPTCRMVNRNAGSGTRVLVDQLLGGAQPAGYSVQPRSHTAVAAAVQQARADWGVAIETVARRPGLSFLPLVEEQYDFVSPLSRAAAPAVAAFERLLTDQSVRQHLAALGLR